MLEILFPPSCFSCRAPIDSPGICSDCTGLVRMVDGRLCPRCGVMLDLLPLPDTGPKKPPLCPECRYSDSRFFSVARSAAVYEGVIRGLLFDLKFHGKRDVALPLAGILTGNFPPGLSRSPDMVIPVPLHIGRLREREFNQSALLSSIVAEHLGSRSELRLLRRTRETRPQFEIEDPDEKRRNVQGAFAIRKGGVVEGLSVLLVDDIYTTGATVEECSRILVEAGALRVEVLTLLRAGTGQGQDGTEVEF